MTDLQRLDVWPKDHGYEIAISDKTLESLDSGNDADQVFIAEVVEMLITEVKTRLVSGQMPFAFDVRNYVNVRVGRGITSQLAGPVLAPERELKRVLRKHFKRPNEQLHPNYPGILFIQSAAALDPVFTRIMVEKLLEEKQPVHLSVVVFVSVLPPESMAYVFFPAFAVANPRARFPAKHLKAFQSLRDIFRIAESS